MARRLVRSLAAVLVLAGAPAVVAAQGVPSARPLAPLQPRVGVGYTPNIPHQFAGASLHYLTPDVLGGLGFYVDAKFDTSSPRDEEGYLPDLTAEQVEATRNDPVFQREWSWQSINFALMRPINPTFVVYAGGGYSRGVQFNQYVDPEAEMGRLGYYWVEEDRIAGAYANFIGGAFFQVGRNVAFQFGGESRPGGFTLGVSYLLPLR